MSNLLRRLISSLIKEEMDSNPRIPTQLITKTDAKSNKQGSKNKDKDKETDDNGDVIVDEECLDEFASVGGGAMVGFSAPLGGKKRKS